MPLELLPASLEDVPILTSIYFSAFQDALALALFPRTEGVRLWWESHLDEEMRNEPEARFLKVIDLNTKEIIAFAKWVLPSQETRADETPSWPEDSNNELCNEFFGNLAKAHADIMGSIPHYYLELLVTLNAHQGRGAGSMLVKWGAERADQEGLEAWLEASEKGLRLYERFGWQKVTEVVTLGGSYIESCMRRRSRSAANCMK
ncbi:MAG: hypothetical protein M1834_001116 [Cirrosporium novae-zelandiae]|nr:MAG: hypothetical protein M1834_001116 [Cirrosporium novae-zelandiae]